MGRGISVGGAQLQWRCGLRTAKATGKPGWGRPRRSYICTWLCGGKLQTRFTKCDDVDVIKNQQKLGNDYVVRVKKGENGHEAEYVGFALRRIANGDTNRSDVPHSFIQ